jgi:hypothetical protein
MSRLKVNKGNSWTLKEGGTVTYYDVGNWYMELIDEEFDEALADAKQAIKVYKAWYKFLKKKKRSC